MFNIMNVSAGAGLSVFIRTPEQRILGLFAMNPGKPFYTREISKALGISLGSAHMALLSLQNMKILTPQFIGKTKLYQLASVGPVIQEFRVLNTVLILDPVVSDLREISRRVVLYGSYARGTFSQESDLDLLVVTEDRAKVIDTVELAKRKTGLDLRPLIMNQLEWMNLEQKSPEFFDELSHGIILWEKPIEESRL
jgi:predicted nucleotidyltransferase